LHKTHLGGVVKEQNPLRKQNTIFQETGSFQVYKKKKGKGEKVKTIFNKKAIFGVFFAVVAIATISTSVALAYSWDPADGLRIDGSTTVFPIVKAALGATAEGATSTAGPFQSVHAVQAQVYQGGSGVGRADASAQVVDLGMASSLTGLASNVTATKIARDGICVIVNNSVAVTDISPAQLKGIYEGNITSWSTINTSASGTIVPLARLVGSGTRDAVADFTGMNKTTEQTFIGNATRYDTNADEAAAVVGTPNSIGYVGIGYAATLQAAGTAKILTVNGKTATAQNVTTNNASKLYPFSRYLYLLQCNTPTDPTIIANASHATAFIQWMATYDGPAQEIVAQQDYIKLVPDSDITMDGIINGLDLTQLGIKWNKRVSNRSLTAGDRADINNDGVVNGLDLTKLGLWWNNRYGTSSSDLTPDYPVIP